MSMWIECLIAIRFDLNEGPKVECVLPHNALSEAALTKVIHCAFPDSNNGAESHYIYSFNMRDCTRAGERFYQADVPSSNSSNSSCGSDGGGGVSSGSGAQVDPSVGVRSASSSTTDLPAAVSAATSVVAARVSHVSRRGGVGGGSANYHASVTSHLCGSSSNGNGNHHYNVFHRSTHTHHLPAPVIGARPAPLYGATYYREKRDPQMRRSYVQQAVVLLSRVPYLAIHELILRVVVARFCQCCPLSPDTERVDIASVYAPRATSIFPMDRSFNEYVYTQELVLEEAVGQIARWPSPHPRARYNVMLLYQPLDFVTPSHTLRVPLPAMVVARPPAVLDARVTLLPRRVCSKKQHSLTAASPLQQSRPTPHFDAASSSSYCCSSPPPPAPRCAAKRSAGTNTTVGGCAGAGEVDRMPELLPVYGLLANELPYLTQLWELIISHEALLIFSPSPVTASSAAHAVASLVAPLDYNGVLRPYMTVQDEDWGRYTRLGQALPFAPGTGMIVAVTNPFIVRQCVGWTNVLRTREPVPSLTSPPWSRASAACREEQGRMNRRGEAEEEKEQPLPLTLKQQPVTHPPIHSNTNTIPVGHCSCGDRRAVHARTLSAMSDMDALRMERNGCDAARVMHEANAPVLPVSHLNHSSCVSQQHAHGSPVWGNGIVCDTPLLVRSVPLTECAKSGTSPPDRLATTQNGFAPSRVCRGVGCECEDEILLSHTHTHTQPSETGPVSFCGSFYSPDKTTCAQGNAGGHGATTRTTTSVSHVASRAHPLHRLHSFFASYATTHRSTPPSSAERHVTCVPPPLGSHVSVGGGAEVQPTTSRAAETRSVWVSVAPSSSAVSSADRLREALPSAEVWQNYPHQATPGPCTEKEAQETTTMCACAVTSAEADAERLGDDHVPLPWMSSPRRCIPSSAASSVCFDSSSCRCGAAGKSAATTAIAHDEGAMLIEVLDTAAHAHAHGDVIRPSARLTLRDGPVTSAELHAPPVPPHDTTTTPQGEAHECAVSSGACSPEQGRMWCDSSPPCRRVTQAWTSAHAEAYKTAEETEKERRNGWMMCAEQSALQRRESGALFTRANYDALLDDMRTPASSAAAVLGRRDGAVVNETPSALLSMSAAASSSSTSSSPPAATKPVSRLDSRFGFLLDHAGLTRTLLQRLSVVCRLEASVQRESVALNIAEWCGCGEAAPVRLSRVCDEAAGGGVEEKETSVMCGGDEGRREGGGRGHDSLLHGSTTSQVVYKEEWEAHTQEDGKDRRTMSLRHAAGGEMMAREETVRVQGDDGTPATSMVALFSSFSVADDIVRKFFISLTTEFLSPLTTWFTATTAEWSSFELCDRSMTETELSAESFLRYLGANHHTIAPAIVARKLKYKKYVVLYERFARGNLFLAFVVQSVDSKLYTELADFDVEVWQQRYSVPIRTNMFAKLYKAVERELHHLLDPAVLFVHRAVAVLREMASTFDNPLQEHFIAMLNELKL